MAQVTDALARLVEQLRGERAGADAGAICLHDAIDLPYPVRPDAQTRAGSGTDGVRRGDEGIRAEVHVEHRALCTLAENGLSLAQEAVDFVLRVHDGELAQVLHAFQPFLLHLRDVILEAERLQNCLVAGLGCGIFLWEVLQNVAHAQTRAAHLVSVGGADALTRGAHLVLALLRLVGSVEHAVRGHDEVCLLRDV